MLIKYSTSLVRSIRPKGCLVVVVSSLLRAAPSQNALFRTCALGNPSIDEQVYATLSSEKQCLIQVYLNKNYMFGIEILF